MRFLSVCSGIEAASQAWQPLGWKAVAFSEIEPFPCAVLAHHYPDVPNWGDMTKYKEWPDVSIDLLCGGTPCQSFSVAGLRKGLDDPRGNLMLTFGAIAAKYRPRWLVWENVAGVLSSSAGRDFASLLGLLSGQAVEVPAGGWQNSGIIAGIPDAYGLAYRVLDAQYVRVESHPRAVPQRRRRVFVVGYLGDWRRAAAVLFERESLSGHPAPSRKAGKGSSACTAPSLTASGRGVERCGESRGQDPVVAVGHYPEEWGPSDNRRLTCSCGNPDPAHMDVLAFGGNDTRGPIEVATARNACASASGRMDFESETFLVGVDLRNGTVDDTAMSMQAGGMGEDRGLCINAIPHAICFDPTQITSRENRSNPQPGDPCHTLAKGGHAPTIAFSAKDYGGDAMQDCSPTLRAGGHDGSHANAGVMPAVAISLRGREGGATAEMGDEVGNALRASQGGGDKAHVLSAMQVRRLTPLETERLMGFKDGYTAIPFRGKPAADGPRYKSHGNSWAVNCPRWIGERIAQVDVIQSIKEAA